MARRSTQQKLGLKIRGLRHDRGLTQEGLGQATELDRTYISGIERGVRNPSLKSIERIAKALGAKVTDLLG